MKWRRTDSTPDPATATATGHGPMAGADPKASDDGLFSSESSDVEW
jgi:hypothetical protein